MVAAVRPRCELLAACLPSVRSLGFAALIAQDERAQMMKDYVANGHVLKRI